MPVTVRQPATVRVRVNTTNRPTTIQTISYGTKTVRGLNDLALNGANTGDVVVYNAEKQTFNVLPIGASTPVFGDLLPKQDNIYNLGSPENRFKSLYVGHDTIDVGGVKIKADSNTGSLAITSSPTPEYPNPIALVLTPKGGLTPVQTVDGEISFNDINQIVANSVIYRAFEGADSGYF